VNQKYQLTIDFVDALQGQILGRHGYRGFTGSQAATAAEYRQTMSADSAFGLAPQ
jgi:hypothetical protein